MWKGILKMNRRELFDNHLTEKVQSSIETSLVNYAKDYIFRNYRIRDNPTVMISFNESLFRDVPSVFISDVILISREHIITCLADNNRHAMFTVLKPAIDGYVKNRFNLEKGEK